MWATMLISGLWHGAAWHFVLWGALHSFYLSVERLTDWPGKLAKRRGGQHLAVLATFVLTIIAWVLFRAQDFGQACAVLARMFDLTAFNADLADTLIDNNPVNVLAIIVVYELVVYFTRNRPPARPAHARVMRVLEPVGIAVLILICVFMRAPSNTFIYFQF
jgi:alginate O-acetyltransferase complex protein AlgI